MALEIYISDAAKTALQEAAIALADHFQQQEGEAYSPEDLQKVVMSWFELTLEELATETLYHCIRGDRSFVVGRFNFENAMKRIKPIPTAEQVSSNLAA